jgi:hypothetical protein
MLGAVFRSQVALGSQKILQYKINVWLATHVLVQLSIPSQRQASRHFEMAAFHLPQSS